MALQKNSTYNLLSIFAGHINRTIMHDIHTSNQGNRSSGCRDMQLTVNVGVMLVWVKKGLNSGDPYYLHGA